MASNESRFSFYHYRVEPFSITIVVIYRDGINLIHSTKRSRVRPAIIYVHVEILTIGITLPKRVGR